MSCIHFTGVQHEACKAGVRYENVRPLPCLGARAAAVAAGVTQAKCDFYRAQTPEELATEEAEFTRRFDQLAQALIVVQAAVGDKAQAGGAIECPICTTGQLAYSVSRERVSRSRQRNYFAVKCSTSGCVEGRGH